MNLDPSSAAMYAVIAICLVLLGGLMVASGLDVAERGALLTAIAAALFSVIWWSRRKQ